MKKADFAYIISLLSINSMGRHVLNCVLILDFRLRLFEAVCLGLG